MEGKGTIGEEGKGGEAELGEGSGGKRSYRGGGEVGMELGEERREGEERGAIGEIGAIRVEWRGKELGEELTTPAESTKMRGILQVESSTTCAMLRTGGSVNLRMYIRK